MSRAFVIFGTLVATAFFLTAVSYGVSWAWLTPELEQSRLAVKSESLSFAAMLEEQNALRTYVLTRDATFVGSSLARAEEALAHTDHDLAASAGWIPGLAAAILETRFARERWRDRWARPAATLRLPFVPPSIADGRILFDAYVTAERALAEGLTLRSDLLARRAQRAIAVRVALELAVFIAILFLAVRQHRALREAIVTPVAALLHHIRRIRDGRLEMTAGPSGPRELAELAEGLNEMVRALSAARESAASRDEVLREHSVRLRQILEASREFSESLNLAYVVNAVRASTAAVGRYARVTVWLMDDEQKHLVEAQADGPGPVSSESGPIGMGQGIAGRAAKSGRITFEGVGHQVRFADGQVAPICAIAVPLIVGARVVGALEARYAEPKIATTEAIEVLEMLATHAATAIESARLHEVIEQRSQMDTLTRLLNRRRLDEDLDAECKRCARYGRPLAFVMLDVDHFKAFNDTHGHPQADTALQSLAEIIKASMRTTDTAYRYGGEEFCILLRETSAQDAMLFAERVRERIEARFATGALAGITASFGVAGFSADTSTPRALVEAADAAMYESKHAGRNRVVLSPAPPVSEPAGVLPS